MKKTLLFLFAIGLLSMGYAQVTQRQAISTKAPNLEVLPEGPQTISTVLNEREEPESFQKQTENGVATFIPIGNTGNAYGYYGNPRTYLWAEPLINSITFTHRMTGGTELEGNSRVAYDVTIDGGQTWETNVQVYTPLGPDPGTGYPLAAGRYPQGAIINPEGNTNPDNAYFSYFIAALDGTNGTSVGWGGYGTGSNVLTDTEDPSPTQTNVTSEDGYFRLIPDAYTTTQQGIAWYCEPSMEEIGADYVYTGELILGWGEIIDDSLIFEEELLSFLEAEDGINDTKIAFTPDGMTGYIVVMSDTESDPVSYTNYHPILLKTTDGGESWSDPIHVQLGGEDGIESLKYYFSDSALWSAGYEIDVDRDNVYYNMGFVVDLITDGYGNPYLTGIIAIGDEDGWYPNEGQMATWNVYSKDGGETWDADPLFNNRYLEADLGDISTSNRPYVSSTYDGHYLFFSWLDSDIDQATANDRPNIYIIGYNAYDELYTDIENVTYFSQAWNRAFYGSQSYYVFVDEVQNYAEIPFVFEEFTVPGDDTAPCDFWYIKGFTIDLLLIEDVPEIGSNAINFTVGQNSPNPATGTTEILVNGQTDLPIELTVSNMLGQVVYKDGVDNRAQSHSFRVNVSDLDPGVYLYTVKIGNKTVTKKMLVK